MALDDYYMTGDKMLRTLQYLKQHGWSMHCIWIGVTGGNELRIEFNGQPSKQTHDMLLARGFVEVDGDYIYRPVIRKRHGTAA